MYSQHALIVDDSKTAQLRLKRMLEIYELEVDVSSSAEEALAYLSYRVPAVIFLDQSMEGMDGIEALRTIKANPNTATIPVIMYTSEKGNVFTRQARALGALDILNKGSLAPSSLEQMLVTLKIARRKKVKKEEQVAVLEKAAVATPSPASSANTRKEQAQEYVRRSELDEVQRQIARLFEIHIADVARQITKSTQFLSKRLSTFAEASPKAPAEVVIGDVPLDVINKEVTAERRRIAIVANGLLVALLVGLLTVGGLLVNLYGRLSTLSEDYNTAANLAEANETQIRQLTEALQRSNRVGPQVLGFDSQVLGPLTWVANTDFGFASDEEPLSERMVSKLQQLLYQLTDINYEGIVEININFGNTCLVRSNAGQLVLAPNEMLVYDCILRASLDEDLRVDNYLSLPYLNFEQSSPLLQEHAIALSVNTLGFSSPRAEYPFASDSLTAGEWNRVSLQNNYLSFAFHPFE